LTNAAEFHDIVVRESPLVFRLLARFVGQTNNLEDLAQEVFLRLFRAMDHFRGESRLTTYIYRIALNVARDEQKRLARQQRLTSLDDPDPGWHERLASPVGHPVESLIRTQFRAIVDEGLARLSERERACLVLYHQEGRSYEAIREILDLPLGTVKAHLHRGRQRLRAYVQERLAEGERARRSS
jgi:RNA polymerase sigma factor (sigma-70 family)